MTAHPAAIVAGTHASERLGWPGTITGLDAKLAVARSIADMARDGETIGIGSGTAAYLVLCELADRSRERRLSAQVVASSIEIEMAASSRGLACVPLAGATIDWMVDGADEVDARARVLKGRGGAMFREKLLWHACRRRYLAIDESKYVTQLGTGFPLPIEVHPQAVGTAARVASDLGCSGCTLRLAGGKDGPVITESGFLILDATFDSGIPEDAHFRLKMVPGVLETGLFVGFDVEIVST